MNNLMIRLGLMAMLPASLLGQSNPVPTNGGGRVIRLPELVELQLSKNTSNSPANSQKTQIVAVAISGDGKYLAPENQLDGAQSAEVVESPEQVFRGWLAKDATFRVVKIQQGNAVVSAEFTNSSSLILTPGSKLIAPYFGEGHQVKVEILKILDPKETGSNELTEQTTTSGEKQVWVRSPKIPLPPGTPLFDLQGHLVAQLSVEAKPSEHPLIVPVLVPPLELLNEAVQQADPIPWNGQPYRDKLPFGPLPFSHREIVAIQNGLNGEALFQATNELLRKYPDSPLAWYLAVQAYHRLHKTEYALASAKYLTQLAPNHWLSWFTYGEELRDQKQLSAAIDAFQKSGETIFPAVPRRSLAEEENSATEPQKMAPLPGEESFSLGQRLAGRALAISLLESGNQQEGLYQLIQHLGLDSEDYEGWIRLGEYYQKDGNVAQAASIAQKILELNPYSPDGWKIHTWGLVKTGSIAEAKTHVEELKKLNPSLAESLTKEFQL